MVFPTFLNLSLNLAIRSSWSETQSALIVAFVYCVELLHLWLQRLKSVWFHNNHLLMSMCKVIFCVFGRRHLLWSVVSLGKTLLAFALLHFVFQGQIYLLLQATALSNSWTAALSNSVKLWAMPCRATQDRRVVVESSDKMSTGERNGKPLQYSSLENPTNSMKR